jgi:hypothetical protein
MKNNYHKNDHPTVRTIEACGAVFLSLPHPAPDATQPSMQSYLMKMKMKLRKSTEAGPRSFIKQWGA